MNNETTVRLITNNCYNERKTFYPKYLTLNVYIDIVVVLAFVFIFLKDLAKIKLQVVGRKRKSAVPD